METAVLGSLRDWTKAIERENRTDVVYFDFATPVDEVPLEKLLFKMNVVEIQWSLTAPGRSFQARVDAAYSEVLSAPSGVRQAEVLQPLVFLLYTSSTPILF